MVGSVTALVTTPQPDSKPATTVTTPTGFADLGVPANIDAGLAAAGFAGPFAIQTLSLMHI
jgi:hypothetical protein